MTTTYADKSTMTIYADKKESIMNWRGNNKQKYNEYMKNYMKDKQLNYGMKKDPEVFKSYMRTYMKDYMKKRYHEKKLQKLEEKNKKLETEKLEQEQEQENLKKIDFEISQKIEMI